MKFEANQVRYDQDDSLYVEPWGGSRGCEWSYKLKGPIKNIFFAYYGGVINYIKFPTIDTERGVTIDSPRFGGNGRRVSKVIFEKAPMEHLTGITGTLGRFEGHLVVKSLCCFITNVKSYGQYESERGIESRGRPFNLTMKGWAIVGFHGRAGSYLDAIGVHLHKLTPPTLPMAPDQKSEEEEEGGWEIVEV
ncbi:mannose/glucose-specific lectin-like [Lycium barbarum]|uniref:mannose/glucose-specific lectin-like n=1 Tax=Lycium barbarum TaxID=112863 RepID=UPI00293F77C3|nr:mannose/glucose-specific lectin-like [Lycium barbarum]